ncbi:MAG: phosphatase PAP2 family protein [Bacteroidota bacterium]|nr:phosphatase PAP2 family protein [Candidatus Kapabacteria bacterium]MDW8271587.1 phosphatase PAP2 family protein [Bacteroidota bacterium]
MNRIATLRQRLGQEELRIVGVLTALDWYTLAIMAIYSTLALLFYPRVPKATMILVTNFLFAIAIVAIAWLNMATEHRGVRLLRFFYVIPMVYPMYQQSQLLVPALHQRDYDWLLIKLDRMLFGVDPTVWFAQFANPWITEYLQVCYVSFYLLPIAVALSFFAQRRTVTMLRFGRMIVFGFYVSYLAYFALPAIGPRFTLHDFHQLDRELPGVWLTPYLRALVNEGGGIEPGEPFPERVVNRDCFPSGHTMMTLLTIILAWRCRSPLRMPVTVIGASLIVATVYLRYHYVVDLIAGAIFAFAMLWLEPRVYKFLVFRGIAAPDRMIQ